MNASIPLAAASSVFHWTMRVYYEDTDAGGIVFYANYLKFFERARTEWLRAGEIEQSRLANTRGVLFVVRRTALAYRSPARLDDILCIISQLGRVGHASIDFEQQAWREKTLLATGSVSVGCVAAQTFKPCALPENVPSALAAALIGRSTPRAAVNDRSAESVESGSMNENT